jgi:hypothetical protein
MEDMLVKFGMKSQKIDDFDVGKALYNPGGTATALGQESQVLVGKAATTASLGRRKPRGREHTDSTPLQPKATMRAERGAAPLQRQTGGPTHTHVLAHRGQDSGDAAMLEPQQGAPLPHPAGRHSGAAARRCCGGLPVARSSSRSAAAPSRKTTARRPAGPRTWPEMPLDVVGGSARAGTPCCSSARASNTAGAASGAGTSAAHRGPPWPPHRATSAWHSRSIHAARGHASRAPGRARRDVAAHRRGGGQPAPVGGVARVRTAKSGTIRRRGLKQRWRSAPLSLLGLSCRGRTLGAAGGLGLRAPRPRLPGRGSPRPTAHTIACGVPRSLR